MNYGESSISRCNKELDIVLLLPHQSQIQLVPISSPATIAASNSTPPFPLPLWWQRDRSSERRANSRRRSELGSDTTHHAAAWRIVRRHVRVGFRPLVFFPSRQSLPSHAFLPTLILVSSFSRLLWRPAVWLEKAASKPGQTATSNLGPCLLGSLIWGWGGVGWGKRPLSLLTWIVDSLSLAAVLVALQMFRHPFNHGR